MCLWDWKGDWNVESPTWPSFRSNFLHVLIADISSLVVTGIIVLLFVALSPIGTDMLDVFLSSVKGSSFTFVEEYYA